MRGSAFIRIAVSGGLLSLTFWGYGAVVQAQSGDLAYRIVEQRSIPNGGFARTIVLSKANPSESVLRSLGERLRQDTKGERNAFVWAYDNERAARNRRAAVTESLSKAELQHHDRHYVALYSRNANTGHHEYEYYPKGFGGTFVKVKY